MLSRFRNLHLITKLLSNAAIINILKTLPTVLELRIDFRTQAMGVLGRMCPPRTEWII